MRIERYTQAYEFFVLPCIKYTYDQALFGFYCVDMIWGKWGFSIQWKRKNKKNDRTSIYRSRI
jgi:hypothetical protein